MLRLEADKMKKAIERAKAERLKVKVISVAERRYAVTGKSGKTYQVRFSVTSSGVRLGECDCAARVLCKHLAGAAAVNMGVQGMRRPASAPIAEPTITERDVHAMVSRYCGWVV